MGVLQRGGELNLPVETLGVDAGRELGREHLDDDLSGESGLLGQEHPAHPATAQLALNAVRRPEGGLHALPQIGHEAEDTPSFR